MLIGMISQKRRHIWPVLYNMKREEVERYINFMLKVVVEDATGGASVVVVTAEEAATVEGAKVDVEVSVEGGLNPIFQPYNILTRSGRFLAMTRRARYLLSTINLNRARLMWSRSYRG